MHENDGYFNINTHVGALRSLVTYETKFYFKVSLPFIAGGIVGSMLFTSFLLETLYKGILYMISEKYRRSLDRKKLSTTRQIPRFTVAISLTMTLVYFLYLTVLRHARTASD